jgi:hypothetical protein
MNAKEMFRQQFNDEISKETPLRVDPELAAILIKRECTHLECSKSSKCQKSQTYNGLGW